MISKGYLRCRYAGSRLAISISAIVLFTVQGGSGSFAQERRFPSADLGLEIIMPDNRAPTHPLMIYNGGRAMTLYDRRYLKISDAKLADGVTGVDVWADGEGDAIRVRLSIIYNDLSNQEWWKDKKEKVIGSFVVRENEPVRPAALAQFGIEPFEMRAVNARPVVFQPGEGPRIINRTKALEVIRLEKSLDGYHTWLKNNSSKNVVAYTILAGRSGIGVSTVGHGNHLPAIAARATSDEKLLGGAYAERDGITIPVVVFGDGTFEGDPKMAAGFLVSAEGIRIQAPSVLGMIERTLEVGDPELPAAFEKLEAQLSVIPEAIDKQSALELLKKEYPFFDDEIVSGLYEGLKGGLYEARNMALATIGELKRSIQEYGPSEESKGSVAARTSRIRETLVRIKGDFQSLIDIKR